MLVRMKYGTYAGQIRDTEPASARQMIADGRATDIRLEDETAPAPGETKPAIPETRNKKRKR